MDGVILLLLGVLAAAVVYVIMSLRNYQRVDYSHLLEQEEYVRALDTRIEYLEQLIASQQDQFAQRERELTALLTVAQQHLAAEVRSAREAIIEEVLATPQRQQAVQDRELARRRAEQGLLSQQQSLPPVSGAGPAAPGVPTAAPATPESAGQAAVPLPASSAPLPGPRRRSGNPNLVAFLRNPRQGAIASYLEAGYKPEDIARLLVVSRHEIDLVESILFRNSLSA
jgi:hypothetical protein